MFICNYLGKASLFGEKSFFLSYFLASFASVVVVLTPLEFSTSNVEKQEYKHTLPMYINIWLKQE